MKVRPEHRHPPLDLVREWPRSGLPAPLTVASTGGRNAVIRGFGVRKRAFERLMSDFMRSVVAGPRLLLYDVPRSSAVGSPHAGFGVAM